MRLTVYFDCVFVLNICVLLFVADEIFGILENQNFNFCRIIRSELYYSKDQDSTTLEPSK